MGGGRVEAVVLTHPSPTPLVLSALPYHTDIPSSLLVLLLSSSSSFFSRVSSRATPPNLSPTPPISDLLLVLLLVTFFLTAPCPSLGHLSDLQMPKRGSGGGGGGREELKEGMPVDDAGGEEQERLAAGRGGGAVGEDAKKKLPSSSSSAASSSSAVVTHAPAARRGGGSGGGGAGLSPPCCQAERCTADLTEAKRYHRRHKVCEAHSKAAVVMVAGLRQRFCQQCSRFHELSEFDEAKRSCRRRLAGHNERRRKGSSEPQGEGSSRCGEVDQNGRMEITLPANSTYKHFQIR